MPSDILTRSRWGHEAKLVNRARKRYGFYFRRLVETTDRTVSARAARPRRAVTRGEEPVERARTSAALQVSEDGDAHIEPGAFADLPSDNVAHAAQPSA